MLDVDSKFLTMINSPVRKTVARVELYEGSTLINTFKYTDRLKSFKIDRVGNESKFFGYGICQKINVKLIDPDRELNITTANNIEAVFGVDNDYTYTLPVFKVSEVHRDENTNELSITAYDYLYGASNHTVAELDIDLTSSYTIRDFMYACARFLGLPVGITNVNDGSFDISYAAGANFVGTETIREALDRIAEATQSIYYICCQWRLTFKRLDRDGTPVLTIDKSKYIDLDSKTNRRLATIAHTTELEDNVSASTTEAGTTQYVRDNPFWSLREDIATLVDNALAAVGGLTINQFDCSWRGNYLLEIGDKIALETKEGTTVHTFLLDDVIEYDGTLTERSKWSYEDNEEETATNPTNLGEAVKQTYARVDKANKQIELMVSDVNDIGSQVSNLQVNTEGITATVESIQKSTSEAMDSVNESITTLTNKVETSITDTEVNFLISSALEDGVSRVETTTGFTFDEQGLSISKSGSEMTTTITEDGMTVYKNSEAVLIADNEGVKAEDLHATTYLIVGANSRFEDYGDRTGCFWIGL